jgi:putative membrane-bound dehydrogenase-like protein
VQQRFGTLFLLAVMISGSARSEEPTKFPVPEMTAVSGGLEPFRYSEANVPFYPASEKWGTMGEPIERMQEPLDSAESIQRFTTPVDFEVQLFAAEPEITKPICMAWDERGRLWIAESVDYPNQKRAVGKGRDRIKICEDQDGDGRADKFTVFAEQLSIPTSLLPAFGGVVVHQAPDTVFLKDTDGDDVADIRHVLFTGWGTWDTHAGPSNLQYGPDNWIWGMQGYTGFDGEIAGSRRTFNRGFYRFRLTADGDGMPQVEAFEFLRSTDNNSWGLGFSEDGLAFGSTANRNPSVYLPVPNRYYEQVRGWSVGPLNSIANNHLFQPMTEKVRQVDHHGGYTAAAGHALYTARTYPREYWNRTAFVCGPTGHLVGTFVLTRDGASVSSRNLFNLLASDDEWSAPIVAEVGPDGNVWVIDWYNFIVQHNPTPAGYETGKGNAYESNFRDKAHGRVYRIVAREAERSTPVSLQHASGQQLVATLKSDNMFWRRHAQRLLVERGKTDVVPQLLELVGDPSVDEIGLNAAAMHALWTLDGLGAFDDAHPGALQAIREAIQHPSPGVRRSALQVMPRDGQAVQTILNAASHADEDAQVRLVTLLALAEAPADQRLGPLIATMLQETANNTDPSMLDAATSAAARHDLAFLTSLGAGRVYVPEVQRRIAIVAEHLARGPQRPESVGVVTGLGSADPSTLEMVIKGLARGWPEAADIRIDDDTDAALLALLPNVSPAARGYFAKLATMWGSRGIEVHRGPIATSLLTIVANEEQAADERIVAAGQLVALHGDDNRTVEQLLATIHPRMSPRLSAGLVAALSASRAPGLGELLIAGVPRFTPRGRDAAMRVVLARPELTTKLLDAIESGELTFAALSLDQRQAVSSHPDLRIASRAERLLERGGDLPNPDRQEVLNSMAPLLLRSGNPTLGKAVFLKQCAKCHTHGSEGTRLGPDLTGMAVHPKRELLVHLIDPSRSVEGNYQVYSVVTNDGRVLTGLLSSESETAVEFFDAEGKKLIVLRADIDELIASRKSLMPDGFEKQVTEQELVDLLEFLTRRGKYLSVPLLRAATTVTTLGMFNSKGNSAERFVFREWSPKHIGDVPFQLIDPNGSRVANAVVLFSPRGALSSRMPKAVELPCNSAARRIHFLGGVSGWGYPVIEQPSVSLIVRLHYADGEIEEHPLRNGVHFADFGQLADVSGSERAFTLRGKQLRYLAVEPARQSTIETIELVKGPDETAPLVMAVTVEVP